ncbi:MAG: hypothetical protein KDB07_11285 [Planctomycetes bacterium]|nr:hypothetical protein [Planctomycetota bacterium]
MRKKLALITLCFVGALGVACQKNETDPEIKAAILALSKDRPESSTVSASGGANSDATLKAIRDLGDEVASVKRNLTDEIGRVKKSVDESSTSASALKALTEKSESNAEAIAAIKQQNEELIKSQERVAKALEDFDFSTIFEATGKAGDVQTELIKTKTKLAETERERDEAKNEVEALAKKVTDLEDSIEGLKGDDVSRHPMVKDLRERNTKLQDANLKLKEDYDAMKLLADQQAEEIRNLKRGVPNPVEKGDAAKSAEPAFDYKISNVVFHADNQQWVVLANHISGKPPALNAECLIVDQDDNIICRVKINGVYPADITTPGSRAQIGGETINAKLTNAPLSGYRIVPSRAISAEGR